MNRPEPEEFGLNNELADRIPKVLAKNKGRSEQISWLVIGVAVGITLFVYFRGKQDFWAAIVIGCVGGWFLGAFSAVLVAPLLKRFLDKSLIGDKTVTSWRTYEEAVTDWDLLQSELEDRRLQEEEVRQRAEKIRERERKRQQMDYWTTISANEFEHEIAELFRKAGYTATVTKCSGDGGVDIILTERDRRIYVQCKRHTYKLGPAPVRELFGVMKSSKVSTGVLVCPAGFTQGAWDFSQGKHIILMGLKRILELNDGKFRV